MGKKTYKLGDAIVVQCLTLSNRINNLVTLNMVYGNLMILVTELSWIALLKNKTFL